MWWKLGILVLLTIVLVGSVIPIRTHAVGYDPVNQAPPQTWSLGALLRGIYFPPTTVALIAAILVAAVAIAFWIVRSAR